MADEIKKLELTKEELNILVQCVNAPRQQDLKTAERLIQLSNKLSQMIDQSK